MTSQLQVPNRRAHGLPRPGADCWMEAFQTVSELGNVAPYEAESNTRESQTGHSSIGLSAFRLGNRRPWFWLDASPGGTPSAVPEAQPEGLRFLLGPTVHQPILCISTPRKIRMCPCPPEIKRVVHQQIGQDWATRHLADSFQKPIPASGFDNP